MPETPPPTESQPTDSRPPLQIQQEFARAWGILRLQSQKMLQVARSVPDAVEVAVVFLLASALLSYIGGVLYPFELAGKTWQLSTLSRLATVLAQLALTVGLIWWMSFLARRFRAPLRFEELFRVLGYAGILFALLLIPSLTLVAFAWWFAVAYVALRSLGQLDAERALLIVLTAVILLFTLSRVLAATGTYLWFGRWSLIAFL